jgi:hypothetical protein
MGVPKRVKEGLFTYRDYLTWPEEEGARGAPATDSAAA